MITASATGGRPVAAPRSYRTCRLLCPTTSRCRTSSSATLRFSNLIGNAGVGDLRLHPESNITTGITTGLQDSLDANGNVVSSQP